MVNLLLLLKFLWILITQEWEITRQAQQAILTINRLKEFPFLVIIAKIAHA